MRTTKSGTFQKKTPKSPEKHFRTRSKPCMHHHSSRFFKVFADQRHISDHRRATNEQVYNQAHFLSFSKTTTVAKGVECRKTVNIEKIT